MNKDLTVGKPASVLWRFCLPLLGSVVFQQLYNIADSLIAGKYSGVEALAAVGNSYEITLIYIAFAFGCNMGCSVIVAQLFGAKNYKDMKTAISTTFIFSFVVCVALTVIGLIFGAQMLRLINTPDNIFEDSKLYLDIYTGGLLFLFFYNISTGIFSALGDSKTPFILLAISSTANVIVDIIFVKELGWGVAGVAWATFICQGVSCISALIIVIKRISNIKLGEKYKKFSFEILVKIIKIAVPSTLQQGFISVGNIIIQGIINGFGSDVVAGYSAAIKLNNMVITSITALGNGMSNFTAQNIGASKPKRIRKGHLAGLTMVCAFCVPVSLLYIFAGDAFVKLFMDTTADYQNAMHTGAQFLAIVAPFYLVVATKLICDGVLRGAGAMIRFMIATFTDLILRVVLAFVLSKSFGATGIWMAWPVGWTVGTIISVLMYLTLIKKLEKKEVSDGTD